MAYGTPSWIAVALVGPETAKRVTAAHSRTITYPSTAGPFGGIGGAALADFTITLLVMRGGDLLAFVDQRFAGWVPHAAQTPDGDKLASTVLTNLSLGRFAVAGLEPPETCPYVEATTGT